MLWTETKLRLRRQLSALTTLRRVRRRQQIEPRRPVSEPRKALRPSTKATEVAILAGGLLTGVSTKATKVATLVGGLLISQ